MAGFSMQKNKLIQQFFSDRESVNFASLVIIFSTITQQGINYLLIPFMTRQLGASGFGEYAIYLSFVMFVNAIFSLQSSHAILHIRRDYTNIEDRISRYLSVLLPTLISYLFLFIIVNIFINDLSLLLNFPEWILLLLIINSLCVYLVSFLATVCLYEKKFLFYPIFTVLVSFFSAILSVYFIIRYDDIQLKINARIIGNFIPYLVFSLGGLFLLIFQNKQKTIHFDAIKKYIPISLPIILHVLAAIVFGYSDRIMLRYIVGSSTAGIYSFAYSIAGLLGTLWTMLNTIFTPYYFDFLKTKENEYINKRITNLISLFSLIFIGFIYISKEFCLILGGPVFAEYYWLVPILGIGIYFNYLYTFSSNYLVHYKKTKYIAMGTVGAAIVNVILNIIFIPIYGIIAATITTLIAYLLLFIFHYFNARKVANHNMKKLPFNLSDFIKWGLITIISILLYYIIIDIFFLRLIIFVIVSIFALRSVLKRKSIF